MKHIRLIPVALLTSFILASCGVVSPVATEPQTAGDDSIKADWQGITFDIPSSIGTQWLGRTVPTDSVTSGAPQNWLIAAHEELTFPNYPVANQYQTARILIFKSSDWHNYNPEAELRVAALKELLSAEPTDFGPQDTIPVLPVFNAVQVFRARVKYFDFQNGSGVRFITQYDQAPIPINNSELFYTFQGSTGDGNYYVAAFFPITQASLPADTTNAPTIVGPDFVAYLDTTTQTLEAAADGSFSPALDQLDTMLQSLSIQR